MMTEKHTELFDIPPEIIEYSLTFAHSPTEVARFSQTCRRAHAIVYVGRSQYLWRNLYLGIPFDDPRRSLQLSPSADAASTESLNWKAKLQERVEALKVVEAFDNANSDLRTKALKTFISMIANAPQASSIDSASYVEYSYDLAWMNDVLNYTGILRRILENSDDVERSEDEIQLLTRLQAIFRLLKAMRPSHPLRSISALNDARRLVYDLDSYTPDNSWGPFLSDGSGRINWRHVAALRVVMSANVENLGPRMMFSRPPLFLDATRAYSAPGVLNRDPRDWAGVEGSWRTFFSFLDYSDFYDFNFNNLETPKTCEFFNREVIDEATRLINLHFHIVRIEEDNAVPSSAEGSEPPPPVLNPKIHFAGTVRSEGHATGVEGTVQMTPDGQIRWRYTSIHGGVPQWRSVGVQVGNVGCAAGVIGSWSAAHHGDEDPVGPFWLWKVDENLPSNQAAFDIEEVAEEE